MLSKKTITLKNMTMNDSVNKKRTLLLIESNETIREELCPLLKDHYDLLQAENGEQGLKLLQENRQTAIILLGTLLADMTASTFLNTMHQDEWTSTLPSLILTDKADDSELEQCLAQGATDILVAPFSPCIILNRINNAIVLHESASMVSAIEIDELTGLYTREAFLQHATLLVNQHPDQPFMLSISDIENFKQMSAHYSTSIVNDLLKQNAELVGMMGKRFPNVVCGRYGRSSFAVLVVADQAFLDAMGLTFNPPVFTFPDGIGMQVKMGLCYCTEQKASLSTLCQYAQTALDSIMHQYGKTFAVFDDSMMQRHKRQEVIEHTMKMAIEQDQFKIYYQPKHDCKTGKLVGAEALIRWIHPEYGFLSPAEFIPIFEQTGFIVETDFLVWSRTCQNQRRWKEQGLPVVPISTNCSRKDFMRKGATRRWKKAFLEANIPADLMHLEVTESLFVDNLDQLVDLLKEIQAQGIHIELDDFGYGYSSLNSLGELPVDIVKLDMSFVRSLDKEKKPIIMRACIDLIHDLGMKATVEGVETEKQLQDICGMNADYIQGYYYSKPLPEKEFEKYLAQS